ncbi:MAG: pyrroline-5-carboxylate reductase [Clostridia bacterium]|nr:pyrroline-5-carboxylate reductase [Clostridia bacterium]
MGGALVGGMIRSGVFAPNQIQVSDVDPKRIQELVELYGINGTTNNSELVKSCSCVILAVKPAVVDTVLRPLTSFFSGDQLLISIAAGITINHLEKILPGIPIIRAMPNAPCIIGAGVTAIALGSKTENKHHQLAEKVLGSMGKTWTVEEKLMDAVTGLSGSGPAYVYLIIEALADGGVLAGLPHSLALALATETVIGAAKMVEQTQQHPGILKNQVTSPGGTTIAGLSELETSGVRGALMRAVERATMRSQELSRPE